MIAVSDYLRRELEAKVPEARGKTEVVDSGVDLERFAVAAGTRRAATRFLCVGFADPAQERRCASPTPSRGSGRGRSRSSATGRFARSSRAGPASSSPGASRTTRSRRGSPRAHVVVPAEPDRAVRPGRCSRRWPCGRSVVATRIGGPPEFVPPEAGVLVDPADEDALVEALRTAAALPCPNPAARAAAEEHDVRRQAEKVEAILERAARGRRA